MVQKNILFNEGEIFIEQSYFKLFVRFLRYGLLAWGGPIAQLALIQKEMVYQEKLISIGYFNRLIAMYQAFPGPETYEICVHLGTQAKGRMGGFIAGFGFMVPGFILTMVVSWLYVLYGMTSLMISILWGIKPAVIAWICKGGIQLGRGILVNPVLWIIAVGSFFAELFHINFLITFIVSGMLYTVFSHTKIESLIKSCITFITQYTWVIIVLVAVCVLFFPLFLFGIVDISVRDTSFMSMIISIFIFGCKCGGFSFGSVYTTLSIIKTEAIMKAHWITQAQFIDGLALTGILPAPFIIVTTFVGYLAYGFWGGVLATLGTFFVPTFIPIFGHTSLNRVSTNSTIRIFLDGITASVAGLIAADVLDILGQILISPLTIGIFMGSLFFIHFYKSIYAIIWIILVGGLLGFFFSV